MTLDEALSRSLPTDRGWQSAAAETPRGVYLADRRGNQTVYHFDDELSLVNVDPHWVPTGLDWRPLRPLCEEAPE